MSSEEGNSVVKAGIAVLLVIVVIGIIVGFVMWGVSRFNSATSQMSDTYDSIAASDISAYDGATKTGSEVVAAIKQLAPNYTMIVGTASGFDYVALNGTAAGTAVSTTGDAAGNYGKQCWYNVGYIAGDMNLGDNTGSFIKSTKDGKIYIGQNDPDKTGSSVNPKSQRMNMDTSMLTMTSDPTAPTTQNPNYIADGNKYYSQLLYDPSTRTPCGVIFAKLQ